MIAAVSPIDTTLRLVRSGTHIECVPELRDLRIEELPWDNQVELASRAVIVKHSTTRSVVRISHPRGTSGPDLYVKRYCFPELRRRIKAALGLSRARNEWRACRAVRARGVGAARPVLVAERRVGLFAYESYLVTEAVGTSTDAAQVVARNSGPGVDETLRRLGRVVGHLHRRGIYHDDLKANHILLTNGCLPENALDGVILIDLYRCVVGRRPSLRRRGVNLAQVLVSLRDSRDHQSELLISGFTDVLPSSRSGRFLLARSVTSALATRRKRRARHV